MAQYFRIKEISAPATVLRQGNLLGIDLGDFIYPDEVDTIVCVNAIIYWDDNTGEHFTWTPGDTVPVPATEVVVPSVEPVSILEATPAEGVVPSTLETGSKNSKA